GSLSPERPRTVLVVDDSAVVRDLIGGIFEDAGLVVRTASDGAAALTSVAAEPPDVVVSDVEMPGVDGFELLARLRTLAPSIPVVLLTTRTAETDRQRALSAGASAYVTKVDLRQRELVDTILRLANRAA